jgi:hypothetical protein
MAHISGIEEHMEVVGADGVHVGTVDRVEGDRIKLTRKDSGQGSHQGHHHYLSTGLVADIENGKVRLSATAANALMFQEEEDEGTSALVTGGASTSSGASGGSEYRGSSSSGTATTANTTTTPSSSYQANSSSYSGNDARPSKPKAGPNWAGIALGTAAAAATAGAAFYARRGKSSSAKADARKFELKLQTDETARLISSTKVEGTPVVGREGEHLGKIDSFMVDKYTGRVAYAVLTFGGTLGMGENLFPLPWSVLDYDESKDGYRLNLTSEQLERAPKFKRNDTPEFNPEYRRTVALFYAR